jgi:uncharacterized phage protein (TIGR02218 family)
VAKTTSAGLAAHLAGTSHSMCWMLRLALKDGTVIGLSDHDVDINFADSVVDAGGGTVRYRADPGLIMSDIVQTATFDSDNFEASVPIGELITRAGLIGGRYAGAEARLFQINWKQPAQGALKYLLGTVTQARPEGDLAVFEVQSEKAKLEQTIGEVLTLQCRTWYGSPLCTKTPESVDAVVASVTDDMSFTVTYAGTFADDYFNFGVVEFTSGALIGTSVDVHDWTAGTGGVILYLPAAEAPAIGDACTIKRGCPRNRPACMERDNIVNYRGEPDLPGSDKILRSTIPGNANA